MTLQKFKDIVKLLRMNYGRDHYPDDFTTELLKEVKDLPDRFVDDEIRAHMRHYPETKDRPKIAAFAKIRRDWVGYQQNEKKGNWFGTIDQAYNKHDQSKEARLILKKFDEGLTPELRKQIGITKVESSHDLVKLCIHNEQWFNAAYKQIYKIVQMELQEGA